MKSHKIAKLHNDKTNLKNSINKLKWMHLRKSFKCGIYLRTIDYLAEEAQQHTADADRCMVLREKDRLKRDKKEKLLKEKLATMTDKFESARDECDRRRLLFTLQHAEKRGLQKIVTQCKEEREQMKTELDHATDKSFLISCGRL